MTHLRKGDGAACGADPVIYNGGRSSALLLDAVSTNCAECQHVINMAILEKVCELN